ncbi:blue light receptor [Tulasnella sp. 425]|nr:blue light receptor [Tulasnella sp. 425]
MSHPYASTTYDQDSSDSSHQATHSPSTSYNSKTAATFDQRQKTSLSSATGNPFHSESIQFQLPSFLLGASTPSLGGGADAFPGSLANLSDYSNCDTPKSSSLDDFNHKQPPPPASSSSSSLPRDARPAAPFMYDLAARSRDPDMPVPPATSLPHSDSIIDATPPQQPANPPQPPPLSLPLPTSDATGSNAPPLYSTTGFDMLGILARVASRPNPTIALGPVDLSCSFVVVDVRRYDHPIIYASPTFFKLTGYESTEVIGRNCRFLQAPDGAVEKGSARPFTDEAAVTHMKKCLTADKECQVNLMNYRKGGIPFLNLVSIIPISGDDSDEIHFHVGFQVDLVHQPHAILQTMRDGSYLVNYSTLAPTSRLQPNRLPIAHSSADPFGALSNPQRSLLSRMRTETRPIATEEEDQYISEFNNLLVENCDDFIHVFSVKGILQYASPALLRELGYDAEDIIGKSISEIAHPQDLTPVLRQLKEASSIPDSGKAPMRSTLRTVQLLFRVKRKNSTMMWLESSGRLHIEAGKTRKSIIFSGRMRDLSNLSWDVVERAGGLAQSSASGAGEFWAKISTSTKLFVACDPHVKQLLGRDREELIGASLLDVVAPAAAKTLEESLLKFVASPSQESLVLRTTLISNKNQYTSAEAIFYRGQTRPPRGLLRPAPTASITAQFRVGSAASPTNLSSRHMPGAMICEELGVARTTNWNYEVETIRHQNDKLRAEIGDLTSRLSNAALVSA